LAHAHLIVNAQESTRYGCLLKDAALDEPPRHLDQSIKFESGESPVNEIILRVEAKKFEQNIKDRLNQKIPLFG